MGAEARSWLEQGIKMSYYPAGVSGEGYLHFRYLAADTLFDWLKHGEATVGKTIRKASNWSARANGNFEQVTVSAGSFPETLRSDLQFSFSGHTESEIEETLYFAHSRGLIKWTQSEQGTPVWTAELASFDVGQK